MRGLDFEGEVLPAAAAEYDLRWTDNGVFGGLVKILPQGVESEVGITALGLLTFVDVVEMVIEGWEWEGMVSGA